jgi:hypothetical protein
MCVQNQKKHGYALTWGEDTCGQLGMRGLQGARSPTLLQGMVALNIKHISASADCSAFVTGICSLALVYGHVRVYKCMRV